MNRPLSLIARSSLSAASCRKLKISYLPLSPRHLEHLPPRPSLILHPRFVPACATFAITNRACVRGDTVIHGTMAAGDDARTKREGFRNKESSSGVLTGGGRCWGWRGQLLAAFNARHLAAGWKFLQFRVPRNIGLFIRAGELTVLRTNDDRVAPFRVTEGCRAFIPRGPDRSWIDLAPRRVGKSREKDRG